MRTTINSKSCSFLSGIKNSNFPRVVERKTVLYLQQELQELWYEYQQCSVFQQNTAILFFHCHQHFTNTFQFLILTFLIPRVHDPTTSFFQGPGGIIQGSSGGAGPSGAQVSISAHHCILHFKLPPSFYKHISIFNLDSPARNTLPLNENQFAGFWT